MGKYENVVLYRENYENEQQKKYLITTRDNNNNNNINIYYKRKKLKKKKVEIIGRSSLFRSQQKTEHMVGVHYPPLVEVSFYSNHFLFHQTQHATRQQQTLLLITNTSEKQNKKLKSRKQNGWISYYYIRKD